MIGFDTSLVDVWDQQKSDEKRVEDSGLQGERSSTARKLSDLLLKKRQLLAERKVLVKEIAATGVKDAELRKMLVLRVEQAEQELSAARHHLERIRSLQSSGVFSQRERQAAEDRVTRAEQALRVPLLELELHDSTSGGVAREVVTLDLQMLDLELGNQLSQDGLFGEIASLSTLQRLHEDVRTAKIREIDWWLEKYDTMREKDTIRASDDGVLTYSPKTTYPVEVGSKHGVYSLAFILQEQDLVAELFLPERVRFLVRPFEEGMSEHGRAIMRFPALHGQTYSGRVQSVGSVAQTLRKNGPKGFRCLVDIDGDLGAVRPGMTVEAELMILIDPAAVAIPLWLVGDPRKAEVTRENGEVVALRGYVIGTRFVVTSGIRVGDRLRVPSTLPGEHAARLAGRIEPKEYLTLKWLLDGIGGRGRWIYRQLVPDGSHVEAGQMVAEAYPNWGDKGDETYQLPFESMDKEARVEIDRIEAQNRLIGAYVAWRKSRMAAGKARLLYLVARYGNFALAEMGAEVNQETSRLDLRNAIQQADWAAADDSGFASEHLKSKYRLDRDLADIAYRKAELASVAALRSRDWLVVWTGEQDMEVKLLSAAAQRQAYSAARIRYQLDLHRAAEAYNEFRKRYDRESKDETCSKLYALQSGRVFHREH
ncbi:MAG: hypothetical protein HQ526_02935, partial [Actinobacteria bacterium]|nr:hypothetical protein [Actinomycetota bacterium]